MGELETILGEFSGYCKTSALRRQLDSSRGGRKFKKPSAFLIVNLAFLIPLGVTKAVRWYELGNDPKLRDAPLDWEGKART